MTKFQPDSSSKSWAAAHGNCIQPSGCSRCRAAAPGNCIQSSSCSRSRAAAALVSACTFLNSLFKLPD
ncbi:hypothetical protein Tco_0484351 [Tanacetum coccineum]